MVKTKLDAAPSLLSTARALMFHIILVNPLVLALPVARVEDTGCSVNNLIDILVRIDMVQSEYCRVVGLRMRRSRDDEMRLILGDTKIEGISDRVGLHHCHGLGLLRNLLLLSWNNLGDNRMSSRNGIGISSFKLKVVRISNWSALHHGHGLRLLRKLILLRWDELEPSLMSSWNFIGLSSWEAVRSNSWAAAGVETVEVEDRESQSDQQPERCCNS